MQFYGLRICHNIDNHKALHVRPSMIKRWQSSIDMFLPIFGTHAMQWSKHLSRLKSLDVVSAKLLSYETVEMLTPFALMQLKTDKCSLSLSLSLSVFECRLVVHPCQPSRPRTSIPCGTCKENRSLDVVFRTTLPNFIQPLPRTMVLPFLGSSPQLSDRVRRGV